MRRRIIEEKYADLIAGALRRLGDGGTETEVTYEDGRKGLIRATLGIAEAEVAAPERRMAAAVRKSVAGRGSRRFVDARFMHNACTGRMRAWCRA